MILFNKNKESGVNKDLIASITILAYDYSITILINGIDIGVTGGKSESMRLFGKDHSMVPALPEDMKKLVCLKPGLNEIKLDFKQETDNSSSELTIELKSSNQLVKKDNLFYLNEKADSGKKQGSITEGFSL